MAHIPPRILIVEDEPDISEPLRYSLERAGYSVSIEENGTHALETIRNNLPSLIVLDLMIPGMGGTEVCRYLRADHACREIPIVMLTARDDETDVLMGLHVGADDYVTKPFSTPQLIARIQTVLARGKWVSASDDEDHVRRYGAFRIDRERHEVVVQNQYIELTATEFRLLFHLATHTETVAKRDDLINQAIGTHAEIIDRNIDVHIRSIRRKLGYPNIIRTIRGVGYRFDPSACPTF